MSQVIITYLKQLHKHMSYYNWMSPFPIFDTEYVNDVNNEIIKMENSKENYDELPVVACKYCDHLNIQNDDVDNAICIKCGSINELREFKNIHQYLQYTNDKRK